MFTFPSQGISFCSKLCENVWLQFHLGWKVSAGKCNQQTVLLVAFHLRRKSLWLPLAKPKPGVGQEDKQDLCMFNAMPDLKSALFPKVKTNENNFWMPSCKQSVSMRYENNLLLKKKLHSWVKSYTRFNGGLQVIQRNDARLVLLFCTLTGIHEAHGCRQNCKVSKIHSKKFYQLLQNLARTLIFFFTMISIDRKIRAHKFKLPFHASFVRVSLRETKKLEKRCNLNTFPVMWPWKQLLLK